MDHTRRFDGKGALYAKARPRYAVELFDFMRNTWRLPAGSIFADVGSGTGIFTAQLLDCGYHVFAVEPNDDMRRRAEERLSANGDFVSVNGCDGHTTLPDTSVDCVTAAQAFHWFDAAAFKKECRRILKPGGRVMLVYNARLENAACTEALARLRQKYNPEFHGFSNGMSDAGCTAFFTKGCSVFRADNPQTYDRQGYTDRVLSSSYSLREDEKGFSDYLAEINAIFDRFSSGGLLVVPTETVAYIGEI